MNDEARTSRRPKVAIAGASGFVGRALIQTMAPNFEIVGLSRGKATESKDVKWRLCDLFSLKEATASLQGCDAAVYLVHSMMPSARLTQGQFEDLDLILADNFARAAARNGVKKIIYLGGIIPDGKISRHLQSRLEVEKTLSSHGVPCFALRAGLIVGVDGSSFDIMRKLVERLPVMVCPGWTSTRTQPIALTDVVTVIANVLKDESLPPGSYDIGGPDVLTYLEMLRVTSKELGKRRFFIPLWLFSPKLSRLWVRLVTGAPRQLIGPLVESLKHPMVARDQFLVRRYDVQVSSFQDCLRQTLNAPKPEGHRNLQSGRRSHKHRQSENTVCSVQRLPLPKGKDAVWVSQLYTNWVIEFLFPFILVERNRDNDFKFVFWFGLRRWAAELLSLKFAPDKSTADRQLFYVQSGLLLSSRASEKGRFEFREVLGRKYVIVALYDFKPALPWWIYKYTQALFHVFVMWSFKLKLKRMAANYRD